MELLGVAFWVGDELGGNLLGGASEEGLGEGLGGYGYGFVRKCLGMLKGQGSWAKNRRFLYGSSNVRRTTQGC